MVKKKLINSNLANMEQKPKLPGLNTPEHHQMLWDYYYKLVEGLKAGKKLAELKFTKDLTPEKTDQQLDTIQRFEEQIRINEYELRKIRYYTNAIPRVPPPEQSFLSSPAPQKRKSWLKRLFRR